MNPKPRILAVDDESWNLKVLQSYLAPQGYEVITAGSAEEAIATLHREKDFDVILTDVMMPGKDGFELCRAIKQEKKFQSVPVILITALQETVNKVNGLEAGAADFVSKPVDPAELSARIRVQLRIRSLMNEIESWNHILEQKVEARTKTIQEKNRQLDESYFLTIEALIMALDAREQETGRHSLRVAFYTTELARQARIGHRELEEIAMGALLHDIGKIGIPDHILLKPGQLTAEEWNEMRKHPMTGWKIIKDIEFLGYGRELVLSHQERFDGSGYPRKLVGESIYAGARFFAVIDTFDAIMSERPYKKAMSFEAAQEIIQKDSGTLFDPTAVGMFCAIPKSRWLELKEAAEHSDFRTLIKEIRSSHS